MEKSMTLDKFLGSDPDKNYGCVWEKFVKLQNKVQGYSCEKCDEPTNKCPFYMPIAEFKEYVAVN